MDLKTLLSDFRRTSDEAGERASFFSTLSNNTELQSTLFGALQLDDPRLQHLPVLFDLLLKWFRHSKESGKLHLVLQYIPNLVAVSFMLKSDKALSKKLDGLLLALYNDQVVDKLGQGTETSFRIQTLATSSLYHDGSRMDNLEQVEQRNGQGLQLTLAIFQQISR